MTHFTPLPTPQSHTCRGVDGWSLGVVDFSPPSDPVACVLAGHAMMADRRTLCRADQPTLAASLVDRGCRVLVPDLRGRGASGPAAGEGADWTYDDLVEDVGAYLALAAELAPRLPLVVVGHSLFGHNVLGWLGRYPEREEGRRVRGFVAMAVALWGSRWTRGRMRQVIERATCEGVLAIARVFGHVPVRRSGTGTADEALSYWRDFVRFVRTGHWHSRDGFDYELGMRAVDCPSLWVASEGDRFCPPEACRRFSAPLRQREEWLVGAPGSGAALTLSNPPGHMGLLTRPSSEPVWRAVTDWILARSEEEHG